MAIGPYGIGSYNLGLYNTSLNSGAYGVGGYNFGPYNAGIPYIGSIDIRLGGASSFRMFVPTQFAMAVPAINNNMKA